ncbi:cellulose biosynthesis cyclic di-GMP-binding regulatory protein BcsB [Mesorhizobium sp. BAC0120]|uniref:cellulose biosynthesis cyclic di-GMP-binding regulatory protein BcsB n=1 Tax=Mesorhizobium sp. BAC0120 TaxID=3090670 RepID=UPI00298C4748|nr:cellulose biosynthesis cyclic di-GMP-binding regulatory protein BcsB [Mesorhizobium sp. BAC0120]MDW6023488.1 cellulose biosynthesis cyclic di-GMP-binding regulatory protein BcsB [Mesorhizobium sp. BAC0120]
MPFNKLVLSGEIDRRSWSFQLTGEQAVSKTVLHLGYQNAVVVAPEASTLEIEINGVSLIKEPVRSSETISDLQVPIPDRLLRSGDNVISVAASLRHRTDCSIQSTYDLWTEIAPARTYLSFANPGSGIHRLEDFATIGVDDQGSTQFNIVVPELDRSAVSTSIVRLAEGVAIAAGMPNQSVTVSREKAFEPGPGRMTIVLGTAAEISGMVPNLPDAAATSPVASFVDDASSGGSILVVSGPNWQAVDAAIAGIFAPLNLPDTVLRPTLSTHSWRSPDAPIFRERSRKTLAEFGVATQEFAGRRFKTDFGFGVPSDFYANDYGEFTLLLDAAYSPEVLPGSHIDIYVNSNIAATIPITQSGGAILRHFPVGVTMRHFRPGANVIGIEAVLMTEADAACAPAATARKDARFVLFDTSEFEMPNFARIARRPELAGISGTGFPYNRSEEPVALFVESTQPEALSAAATLLARMSVVAGRPIPIETMPLSAAVDRNAIFVGSIGDIQGQVLSQLGVSQEIKAIWGNGRTNNTGQEDKPDTDATFARWREELSGRGWHGRVSALQDWFSRTFDLTVGSFRLLPRDAPPYSPGRDTRMVMAQKASPGGGRTWTAVTAPNPTALRDATFTLVSENVWNRISGQIVTLNVAHDLGTISNGRVELIPTQPFSLTNYRLIAANWLSANPLSYACALFIACCLLGLATAGFLSGLGRHK